MIKNLSLPSTKLKTSWFPAHPMNQCKERGWIVQDYRYGKWFISRKSVADDWKQDQKQAYPNDIEREPDDDEIETWFYEQISWIEVFSYGHQVERPDMAAIEVSWIKQMNKDANNAACGDYDAIEV